MNSAAPRRLPLAALAVLAAALAVRVGWVLREGPPAPLVGDAAQYRTYADSLAETGSMIGPGGDRATRMPGYPAFLAGLKLAFGPSTRAVQWAQCLAGALGCLFLILWARSALAPEWALACGLAAAVYYDLVAPCAWTLSECLYSSLLAGSYCALFASEVPGVWRGVLTGTAFALTGMVRPEVLPFAVIILGAAPFILKGFTRRAAVLGILVVGLFGAAWAGRNALVLHRFIPVSTNGNSSRYYGLRLALDQQPIDVGPVFLATPGLDELGREAEFAAAFKDLRARVPLVRRVKAYAFNLLTLYYPFLPEYDWTYALLVPFWLFGLALAIRRRELWPAAALVLGLDVVFFFTAGPVSRYRFGFSPCLIFLAGAGAQGLRERLKPKAFFWGAAAWTAANLTVWLASEPLRHAVLRLKTALWS